MSPRSALAAAFTTALLFTPAHAAEKGVAGITQPYLDVTLSAPVQGWVNGSRCKEGDELLEGQPILELDSKIEELEAARRKAVMELSLTDLEMTRSLVKKTKAVSREELDKKTTEYNVALAEFKIAEEQLRRRQIVAPFAGTVMELFLQQGASCEPFQPLARVVDTKRCYFVGYVDSAMVAGMKVGQAVKVEVAGQTVWAKVAFISPVVDSASGLTKVKALFENPTGAVRPGVAARMLVE